MNRPVNVSKGETPAGIAFASAVVAVQEKLREALETSDTKDPSVKNILSNFDLALRGFYDVYERRNELYSPTDDEEDDSHQSGSQGHGYDDDDDDDESSYDGEWSAADDDECMQHPTRPAGAGDADNACSICMGPYTAGEVIRVLPCKHEFHAPCIDEWIKVSNRCPMCKDKHMSDSEDSGEGA